MTHSFQVGVSVCVRVWAYPPGRGPDVGTGSEGKERQRIAFLVAL